MNASRFTLLITTLLSACILANTSSAQTLFETNPKNSNNPQTIDNSAPNQVMTPEQFSNTVSKLNQQTNSSLAQETDQQFIKDPIPAANDAASASAALPLNNDITNPATTNQNSINNSFTQETPYTNNNGSNSQAPISRPGANTLPPGYAPAPEPQRTQPYSGFGTGAATGTQPSSSSSSGQWNVKY